jgi:hypothetical protein
LISVGRGSVNGVAPETFAGTGLNRAV